MKKITDPKLLKEWYETEADWKMLIGYRFKGGLGVSRNGRASLKRHSARLRRKIRKSNAGRSSH
jgi:hypothetical protein